MCATLREDQGDNVVYQKYGKRILDIVLAAFGALVSSPLMLACGLLVKQSSAGPILFRQERVGRWNKAFTILKFRTMCANSEASGPTITASGDPRITPVGAFLRRYKLDELPQLFNVLRGDMSFVGPRPELACHLEHFSPVQLKVLSVRPGITCQASIAFCDEEEQLRGADDPIVAYRQAILPVKLELGLSYLNEITLRNDCHLILKTIRTIGTTRNAKRLHSSWKGAGAVSHESPHSKSL